MPGDAPRQSACGREIVDEPETPPAGRAEIVVSAKKESFGESAEAFGEVAGRLGGLQAGL